MKIYKKPVISVKGITEKTTLKKKTNCSGCSSHISSTKD